MRPQLDPAFLKAPIAHRALHDAAKGRTENSLAAVEAAVAAGYGIEIDVQQSGDGQAMVFHDPGLKRLTGRDGAVRALPADELSRIPLKTGGGTIPRLTEVLSAVGGRVPLLIEIKDQDGAMGPRVGTLEQAVARDLSGYAGPVAVMSFNPHSMIAMKDLAPTVPRGLTTAAYKVTGWRELPAKVRTHLRAIADFDAAEASFISHEASDLGRKRVAAIRAEGYPVLCWTIRSPEAEAAARRIADNVTFEGYPAAIPAA